MYCFAYVLVQNIQYVNIYFTILAGMNIGVMTVIYSINSIAVATGEYLMFKVKLARYHIIGISIMLVSAVL